MSVAERRVQVRKDFGRSVRTATAEVSSVQGRQRARSTASAEGWTYSDESYEQYYSPGYAAWGYLWFTVDAPPLSQYRPLLEVDIRLVDTVTGEEHSYMYPYWYKDMSQPERLGMAFEIDPDLIGGRQYYARLRFRPNENPDDYSPWFTSGTYRAVETPGVPAEMAGPCVCPDMQAYQADPVNTATGAFVESFVDVEGTGPGVPLKLSRHYSSLSTTPSAFGSGWSWPYGSSLTASADEVVLQTADGATVRYTKDAQGGWNPPAASVGGRLTQTAGGWEVAYGDDTTYRYSPQGQLTGVVDPAGVGVTLSHTNGRPTTITEAGGRTATLTWTGEHITGVQLSDGREVSYSYTNGRLTGVTDVRGETTSYEYDTAGRMTTVTDESGRVITRNTYDPDTGRVSEQVGPTGFTTRFTWDPVLGQADTIAPGGGCGPTCTPAVCCWRGTTRWATSRNASTTRT